MKIKMLPNWGKKLGLSLFFIGLIVVFTAVNNRESFCEGFNEANNTSKKTQDLDPVFIEKWFGESVIHFFEVLTILGLLVYMLSKEKIEDDYINMLRLESYQLTAIFGLISTILFYSFLGDFKLGIDVFITLFLVIYLICFAIKKRSY